MDRYQYEKQVNFIRLNIVQLCTDIERVKGDPRIEMPSTLRECYRFGDHNPAITRTTILMIAGQMIASGELVPAKMNNHESTIH